MMYSGSSSSSELRAADLYNEPELNLDSWIDELYNVDFLDPFMDAGLEEIMANNMDDIMAINPDYTYQPYISTVNSSYNFGEGSTDKAQSGIPHEMMTSSSSNPNSSTSTLHTSGHNRSPIPHLISGTASTSSISCRTNDMLQPTTENQRLKQPMVLQNSPSYATMCQPTTFPGHHINEQMTLDQIRPGSWPASTTQAGHRQNQMVQPFQNQNQMLLQFQQPVGTSNTLIPEGGQHTVQGVVIGGHRRPPEQRARSISDALSVDVGFKKPHEFPTNQMWREYAFREIQHLNQLYATDLLKIHRKAVGLCIKATEPELSKKYTKAKEFLEKMITFLKIATIEMVPKNRVRVYNYMNFIVNYVTSAKKKNDGNFLNIDQIGQPPNGPQTQPLNVSPVVIDLETNMLNYNQQPINQPVTSTQTGHQVNPNGDMRSQYNPTPNNSQAVIKLEPDIGNFNWQPVQQTGSSSQRRSQIQPNNGDVMKSQSVPPLPSPRTQRIIMNREANMMMSFNHNFPSRRTEMPSTGSCQIGTVNNPIRIGSQKNVGVGPTQRSNLGPKTTTSGSNVSGSSGSANLPISRQVNHNVQPSRLLNVNRNLTKDKMKQPVRKSNELIGSKASHHVLSPLGEILKKPIVLQPTRPHSVSSYASNVLTPQSIARSPFILGTSSSGQHYSSSSLSSVSSVESQMLPEIPILAGVSRDQRNIKNQVSVMGPPKTPTPSPINTPCTEKSKESQVSKDPFLRLMEAVNSSTRLGSSIIAIDSVQKDLDSIPAFGEPTKPIGGDNENTTNFVAKYDDVFGEGKFDSLFDSEPANLDHLNLGEEIAFLFSNENYEPERQMKRKISTTSASHTEPEFSDYDFDLFFNDDWDNDSTVTSMNKKPKTESKNVSIMEEIKEFNRKVLETSLEMKEDSKSILKGHDEGIVVTCIYKNVCFPDLFKPQEGVSSQMMPEFRVKLLVPVNYPASSPTIVKGNYYNLYSAPWPKLYEETLSNFNLAVRKLPEPMLLADMAREWDASARSVITEFVQKRGGKSFSTKYGSWESSSSGSN